MRNRILVLHGVNLDQLGGRDPVHYGHQTLSQLEQAISAFGVQAGLETVCFQTNHEGEFVEHLHDAADRADGLIINAGAWTHYSYAIHDAIDFTGLPAVEVHLSDIDAREDWRRHSVLEAACIAVISGKLADGYREALELLRERLAAR